MGKLKVVLMSALVLLSSLVLVLILLLLSVYGKKSVEVLPEKAITCYVCEAKKNYPDSLSGGNSSTDSMIKVTEDIDGCLTNPKFQKQCDAGQYCAVLHQKLNEVERVVRSCSTGGKLGCNTDVVTGIKEKACWCNSDLCMQIPFFYED